TVELRRSGLDIPVFGGDAMGSPALIQDGGEAVEGTVVASFFHPGEPRPEVAAFVADFQSRYQVLPDPAAALAYDCLRLLAEAMRRAPTLSPEEVARTLREIERWPGVTGPFTFDEHGNLVQRKAPKMVVRNGEFVYLPEAEAGDGTPDQEAL
ncbi:MAG: ABC transporter substrate-binding protein, partial [bacterium]|nr:ABC transporter substrate-binding protein [bacterium]